MGDFLFADQTHPVLEVLPNDGRVDTLTPDYLVDHSLFTLLVKCTDSRQRFDGGAVIGERVSAPITDAMSKLASHELIHWGRVAIGLMQPLENGLVSQSVQAFP
ncbi:MULTISPECIES: hypothetical protein [unclassified Pseudomonas]|uniref:hypothetical protein n=1 Tax=unclassified Pseudomonas TaxID=196821 RepID=UPI00128E3957|nr:MULTISPECIES: hypothetical protein [unclassified Pseudomonas]MPQ71044.1 hypothetical protein [Pseudomonas sp. MWU12-2323]